MFVIVRDEDVPTVTEAVGAIADDAGLERIDPDDVLGMLAGMTGGGAQVRISQTEAGVVLEGLDTLDLAEGDEWAASLGKACSAEVIAIEGAEVGLLVHVFDEEAEPPITVVRKGNRWDTAAIAYLADEEQGEEALARGITADDLDGLADRILHFLGATPSEEEAVTLSFRDPLDDEEEEEPGLSIALVANELRGRVSAPVQAVGPLARVQLAGVPEVEGLRVVVRGDALALASIEALEAHVRTRGATDVALRTIAPSHADDEAVVFLLPDAYLASTSSAMPALDGADLFSSMQALMSATSESMLNTLVLAPLARGKAAGSASLELVVAAIGQPLEATIAIPVHVTK